MTPLEKQLAEALRTGLEAAQELLAIKREALGEDYARTRSYWAATREIATALAAYEEQAAQQGAVTDPALVLWQAMNEAQKVGNRSDDKLIVEFLRRSGYGIAALAATSEASNAPAPADEGLEALRKMPQEAVDQLKTAKPAPSGWKLVPVEPTPEMIEAANDCEASWKSIWPAMLDAAPQPPEDDSLRKDAERYRWICRQDHIDRQWVSSFDEFKTMRDNSIDAAMIAPTLSELIDKKLPNPYGAGE